MVVTLFLGLGFNRWKWNVLAQVDCLSATKDKHPERRWSCFTRELYKTTQLFEDTKTRYVLSSFPLWVQLLTPYSNYVFYSWNSCVQIKHSEIMEKGARVYVPVSVAESKVSKRFDVIPRGTLYPNADEINYLQRLVKYKACLYLDAFIVTYLLLVSLYMHWLVMPWWNLLVTHF